jgi:hypothetical protein
LVCPIETTTYVLTATGPGGRTSASTTITVVGGLPDLTVDSITFDPETPVSGQSTQIQIAIRNKGEGAADAFNWEWQAGSDATFDGRVLGMNAGDTCRCLRQPLHGGTGGYRRRGGRERREQ